MTGKVGFVVGTPELNAQPHLRKGRDSFGLGWTGFQASVPSVACLSMCHDVGHTTKLDFYNKIVVVGASCPKVHGAAGHSAPIRDNFSYAR